MNGQTLTADDLLWQIDSIQKALDDLKKKVVSIMPPKYGSDVWWKESDNKAIEQIKQGKYKSFKTTNELMQDLNSWSW